MNGGITAMRNIVYDGYRGPRMSPQLLMQRVQSVMENELTEKQRRVLHGYYFEEKNLPTLAAEFGVNKSSVCRTLHRAENRLRRFLRY